MAHSTANAQLAVQALPDMEIKPADTHNEIFDDDEKNVIGMKGDVAETQMKSSLDKLTIKQALSIFRVTILICFMIGFTASTDGYQNKLAANIVANKGFVKQFGDPATGKLKPQHVSVFGGIFSAGQVLGQFGIQWPANWIGRKGAAWVFMLMLIVSVTVEVTSKEWWHFALGKLLAGLGVGASQAVLPLFINEHAPVQIRGILLVAYSLWFSVGGLLGSIVLKVRGDSHPLDWKVPIYTQYAMTGLSMIIFVFIPESPWWLISKGKMDKARKVLANKSKTIPGYDLETEVGVIAATIERQRAYSEEQKLVGVFAIFKGLNGKRFLIGSWPKVLQQFVGLSVFSSYSAYFFKLAGNKDPFSVTVILACCGIAAVIFDALLVDKIGRRLMTLIGFSGACFGVTLMGIVGCFDYERKDLGAVLVFAGVFASFFNWFQSSTSYAYLTEMPDQRLKALSTGLGLSYCNMYAVLFNFTVPLMLDAWQVKTAFLFVGLGVPGTILAYFILPESMGRSPAEIDELFQERVTLRKWKGHVTAVERDLAAREQLAQA